MHGWIVPPPKEPAKSTGEFERERAAKVEELAGAGLLKSERIRGALLQIPREEFIPYLYRRRDKSLQFPRLHW